MARYDRQLKDVAGRLTKSAARSDSLRGWMFTMLGNMGPDAERTIPVLSKLLDGDDQYCRIRAAITLWRIDRKSSVSVPPLIAALGDAKLDTGLRAMAASGLGTIGPEARAAASGLRAAMEASQPELRLAAARALWRVAGDRNATAPVLLRHLGAKERQPEDMLVVMKTLEEMVLDKKLRGTSGVKHGRKMVVGFAQIGSESDWRAANTASIIVEAKRRGIDLRFSDAQQRQENQIKAIRTFIKLKVDVIAFSPIVSTGWADVLQEAKAAGIPVVLTDRGVDVDGAPYVTVLSPDLVEEGRAAARWFVKNTKGSLGVFELRGVTGSQAAIDRQTGFYEVISKHKRIKIVKSADGGFMRSKGREVTEAVTVQAKPPTFR